MHTVSLRLVSQRSTLSLRCAAVAMRSSQAPKAEMTERNEYWDSPQYPPIEDISPKAVKLKKRERLHKAIQNIYTVEEKQIALNMPKYYGFKCLRFHENSVPYNALPLVQWYTRTHLVEKKELPEFYKEYKPAAALLAKEIKGLVEDAIVMENDVVKYADPEVDVTKTEHHQKEDHLAQAVVRQINRIITNSLADRLTHVLSVQVDYNPRHEAFWFVGGVPPSKSVKRRRFMSKYLKNTLHDPVNRPVMYAGSPLLALRCNQPLREIVSRDSSADIGLRVPEYRFQPESAGYFTEHLHGANVPGFWTGDLDEFGLLSIHGRGHILARKPSFGEQDNLEALDCQAIKSSFGWLAAQAAYQGFTTYNDLTYPLVGQTIITNGQLWSLYAYQLNTIKFHDEFVDKNPLRNICYGTAPMKLYESIDNGKLQGFNEDVLKQIIQLYLNAPEAREYDMKPYLSKDTPVVADYKLDLRRNWLEQTYKNLVSNRPRHRLLPEIYPWEWIYKIKFDTRFQDARRRFFELDESPFSRRLDDHVSEYIPRACRPYARHGKKFAYTYYPRLPKD